MTGSELCYPAERGHLDEYCLPPSVTVKTRTRPRRSRGPALADGEFRRGRLRVA